MNAFQTPIEKKIQAAAILLREEGGRMDRLRLLKLLYIADREALKEIGMPIVGGHVVAMDNGPLHSEVYDLIKGVHDSDAEWSEFFENSSHVMILRSDPGHLELSRYEIEKLKDVSLRFRDKEIGALIDYTHDFEEWKRHFVKEGTSAWIPLDSIMEAVGLTQAQREEIKREAAVHARFSRDFVAGRVRKPSKANSG